MRVCNENALLISRYIDGDLDEAEARALREHLASCEACRLYYQQLCDIGEQLNHDIEYPASLHANIMAAVEGERKRVVRFRPRRRIAAAAAAIAVVAAIGVFAVRSGVLRMGSSKAADETAMQTVMISAAADSVESAGKAETLKEPAYMTSLAQSAPETYAVAEPQAVTIENTALGWLENAGGVTVYNDADRLVEDVNAKSAVTAAGPAESGETIDLEELAEQLGEDAQGYAFCIAARGPLERLPDGMRDRFGALASGDVLLVAVENDAAVRDEIADSMAENGFAVAEDDGTAFALDPQADEGLVIIELDR